MDEKQTEKKMANIVRGSYWFGIIGRMMIFLGTLSLLSSVFLLIPHIQDGLKEMDKMPISLMLGTVQNLFVGWLFLMARDAFDSIIFVMNEIKDTI